MKKQRILSFLLALVMTVSLLPGTALAAKTEDFTDVSKSDWFYKYVDFVTDEEYFVGTSETTFSPEMSMTRAMFVVVLAALEGAKVDNNVAPFADVPAGTWYSGAVKWAADNGVVAGVGDNKFAPDTAISREQMAAMMDAYVDWHSAKHGESHKLKAQVKGFGDSAKIASWATEAVENCRVWGLIAGAPDGNYYPQNTATRAEVATVIYNLAWLVYGGGGGGGTTKYYTVTYYMNDGTENTFEVIKNIKSGNTHNVIDTEPTREGYTFEGWNTKADGTGTAYNADGSFKVTSNVELYAQWKVVEVEEKYTVTYFDGETQVAQDVDVIGEYEITKKLDNADGKYFIGWKSEDGETIYDLTDDAADKITVSSDVKLYAVWVVDYIYNALNNIEVTVKDKAQEKLNAAQDAVIEKLDGTKVPDRIVDAIGSIEFADKNGDGQFSYGVENGNSYVIVSGVTVGEPNEINTDTHETIAVEAQIEADADTIVYIAETAITKAAELMGFAAEKAPTKAEIQQIVDDLVAKLKDKVTGIDITKAEAKEIVEAVYAKVEAKALAGLNYTKELWVTNFKQGDHYITDDITIAVGDTEVMITVDDELGAYYEGSKKDAIVDLATAMAKELIADLKECTDYTALDEIVLDAEATITFKGNEAAEEIIANTDYFPYVYPVTASMKITGSAADNIEYQYVAKNAHNVKFNVTEGVETAYVEILNKALDEVTLEALAISEEKIVEKVIATLKNVDHYDDLVNVLADESITNIDGRMLQTAMDSYIADTRFNDLFLDLKSGDDTVGLVYYIEALVCDELLGYTKFATDAVVSNGKAAAANLSVDQLVDIAEAAGVIGSNYAKYVEKLAALKSLDTLKDVELGSLAVLLNTDVVKNAYAKSKDVVIGRLTDLVRFIPDEASVVVAGKTITEEDLDAVREAETVEELCKAAADLLKNLKGLSLSDFDNGGKTVTVKYEGANYQPEFTLGLWIDFAD